MCEHSPTRVTNTWAYCSSERVVDIERPPSLSITLVGSPTSTSNRQPMQLIPGQQRSLSKRLRIAVEWVSRATKRTMVGLLRTLSWSPYERPTRPLPFVELMHTSKTRWLREGSGASKIKQGPCLYLHNIGGWKQWMLTSGHTHCGRQTWCPIRPRFPIGTMACLRWNSSPSHLFDQT